MSNVDNEAAREVEISNQEGLHTRPVMRFVDLALKFKSKVRVTNISRDGASVDGKSAMEMMLLEATKGSVLRIAARGQDARETADALAALVEAGFGTAAMQQPE